MRKSFTLAEVLVTLTIIGVIAALTIPNLIQNVNKEQYVNQLKKSYSTFSQAFNMISAENGGDVSSLFDVSGGDSHMLNVFANKLNIVKKCGTATGCWYDSTIYFAGGDVRLATPDTSWSGAYGKAILADGSLIRVDDFPDACSYTCNGSANSTCTGPLLNSTCGQIELDVNGAKGPNAMGRDIFFFWITKTGIYPQGVYNDGAGCWDPFNSYGRTQGCAAKILTENAMNY